MSGATVTARLAEEAALAPARTAIVAPDGTRTSYGALEERCERLAAGLARLGLSPGDRALVFVPPGAELVALTHGLLRVGAVPVLIDPGMGREALLGCVRRAAPRALLGVPRAHLARLFFPGAFRSVELAVCVGRRLGRGPSLAELERAGAGGARPAFTPAPEATAAILFTSGSTGPAKGVVTTHAVLAAQADLLQALYGLEPGQVDAACFPLFALFDHALGMTSVFPALDPSRPGSCDPARVARALDQADFSFGSPAIWRRVHAWARARGVRFPRLRRLTSAGAPVPPRLLLGLRELLPAGGEVHTPYGATEALPVSDLPGALLAGGVAERTERGEGTCVGRLAPGIEVRLVRIEDGPLERFGPELLTAPGEPGEICVRGAVVTPAYADDAEATRAAKIPDPAGGFWHRMGDVGRLDEDGLLWILGRKSHRLETERGLLLPVPHENVYDTLEGVEKSALVGVGPRGRERPTLIVQPRRGASRRALRTRVLERARTMPDGPGGTCVAPAGGAAEPAAGPSPFAVERVLFRRRLPTDVRHNAKIERGLLKRWAEERLA